MSICLETGQARLLEEALHALGGLKEASITAPVLAFADFRDHSCSGPMHQKKD